MDKIRHPLSFPSCRVGPIFVSTTGDAVAATPRSGGGQGVDEDDDDDDEDYVDGVSGDCLLYAKKVRLFRKMTRQGGGTQTIALAPTPT